MSLLTALFALVLLFQEPAPPASAGPLWHDDLAAATTLAAESGRPLLVVFR